MTSPPIGTDQELIERLTRTYEVGVDADEVRVKDIREVCTAYRNPDGPEAADALQSRISEVERLTTEQDEIKASMSYRHSLIGRTQAEVERLREALTDIRNRVLCPVGPSPTIDDLQAIASSALSQQGKV